MRESALIIITIIVLWALSGAAVAWGLHALYGVQWVPPCATLNIVLGLILLQLVTRRERGRRQVYEGVREEDHLNLGVAALVGVPIILATIGLIWWLASYFVTLP